MRGMSYIFPLFLLFVLSGFTVALLESSFSYYKTKKLAFNTFVFEENIRSHFSLALSQFIVELSKKTVSQIDDVKEVFYKLKETKILDTVSKNNWSIVNFSQTMYDDYSIFNLRIKLEKRFELGGNEVLKFLVFEVEFLSGKVYSTLFPFSTNEVYGAFPEVFMIFPYHFLYEGAPAVTPWIDSKEIIAKIFGEDKDKMNEKFLKEKLGIRAEIPIVSGIYAGLNDDGVFFYIKGEVESLEFETLEDKKQFILINLDEKEYRITISPEEKVIVLSDDGGEKVFNENFSGLFLVDGNINELYSEDPSKAILPALSFHLIVGGKVKIKSSLLYSDLQIKKGAFRNEKTKFVLQSVGEELFGDDFVESEILVDDSSELSCDIISEGEINIYGDLKLFGSLSGDEVNVFSSVEIYENPLNYREFYPTRKTSQNETVILRISFIEEG